jgi:hypothetical protein
MPRISMRLLCQTEEPWPAHVMIISHLGSDVSAHTVWKITQSFDGAIPRFPS